MSKIKILNKMPSVSLSKVDSAYIGTPNNCMCGCSGNYYYLLENAKDSEENRGYPIEKDEINKPMVEHVIEILKKSDRIEYLKGFKEDIYTTIFEHQHYTLYLFR